MNPLPIKHKEGQAAMVDCYNYKTKKVDQLPGIVTGIVSALDREYRVNLWLQDGKEIREAAPECVHIN